MIELDFSLLPTIVRSAVFAGIPHYLGEELKLLRLPETLDRLRGASWFMGQVYAQREDWLNRVNLRAGLSEFRSVKRALDWDLGNQDNHSPGRSKNPLVHLVFRLRRVAVYLQNAQMSEHETTVTYRFLDEDKSADVRVLLIDDVERYLRLEGLKDYRSEDITQICQWFEMNQRKFGATQILDIGIFLYCEELCDVYTHRKKAV